MLRSLLHSPRGLQAFPGWPATFRAVNDLKFRVETGNPQSSCGWSAQAFGRMAAAVIVLRMG